MKFLSAWFLMSYGIVIFLVPQTLVFLVIKAAADNILWYKVVAIILFLKGLELAGYLIIRYSYREGNR